MSAKYIYYSAIFVIAITALFAAPVSIHQVSYSDPAFPNGKDEVINLYAGVRFAPYANEHLGDGCDVEFYSALNGMAYVAQMAFAGLAIGSVIIIANKKSQRSVVKF